MKERCINPNSISWDNYGGAGITVCERWLGANGFSNFFADMGERPEGTTLDRKNAFGNYTPENCAWANSKVQANNQRRYYVDGQPPEEVLAAYTLPPVSISIPEGAEW